jgi:hypothetical protein
LTIVASPACIAVATINAAVAIRLCATVRPDKNPPARPALVAPPIAGLAGWIPTAPYTAKKPD